MGLDRPYLRDELKTTSFQDMANGSEGAEEFWRFGGASRENFAPAKQPPRRLVTGDLLTNPRVASRSG